MTSQVIAMSNVTHTMSSHRSQNQKPLDDVSTSKKRRFLSGNPFKRHTTLSEIFADELAQLIVKQIVTLF